MASPTSSGSGSAREHSHGYGGTALLQLPFIVRQRLMAARLAVCRRSSTTVLRRVPPDLRHALIWRATLAIVRPGGEYGVSATLEMTALLLSHQLTALGARLTQYDDLPRSMMRLLRGWPACAYINLGLPAINGPSPSGQKQDDSAGVVVYAYWPCAVPAPSRRARQQGAGICPYAAAAWSLACEPLPSRALIGAYLAGITISFAPVLPLPNEGL